MLLNPINHIQICISIYFPIVYPDDHSTPNIHISICTSENNNETHANVQRFNAVPIYTNNNALHPRSVINGDAALVAPLS